MKYKDRDELVQGLRDMADFIEARGLELPINHPNMKLTTWLYDDYGQDRKLTAKQKARRVAKKLGKAEKVFSNNYLDIRRDFGPVCLEFTVNREKVCERKVVGVKQIEEEVIPAYEIEEVEWVCTDPILRG